MRQWPITSSVFGAHHFFACMLVEQICRGVDRAVDSNAERIVTSWNRLNYQFKPGYSRNLVPTQRSTVPVNKFWQSRSIPSEWNKPTLFRVINIDKSKSNGICLLSLWELTIVWICYNWWWNAFSCLLFFCSMALTGGGKETNIFHANALFIYFPLKAEKQTPLIAKLVNFRRLNSHFHRHSPPNFPNLHPGNSSVPASKHPTFALLNRRVPRSNEEESLRLYLTTTRTKASKLKSPTSSVARSPKSWS